MTTLVDVARPEAPSVAPTAHDRPFRADVQGMRAVAVGLVVLYHAGVPWLAGGYVGVDVFFVISGFLITGHLVAELERTGAVRLRRFYARRIRRLLPASALVLLSTIVAAKILLPPLGRPDASRDATAAATYVSNLLFAQTGTDYLANDAPSLVQHYWSLALEEQFYLVWPLLLVLVGRRMHSRRSITAAILVVSVTSLVLCVRWTGTAMQPWAYFTLPSRAWELGCGAVLALTASAWSRRIGTRALAVAARLGLVAVVASAVLFGSATRFPGPAALLPVLGTVAVVLGGTGGGTAGPLPVLGRRPLQFIGDISYPLYLWHWPLLVFPTLYRPDPMSPLVAAALVGLAVVLAAVTHHVVERPFSRSRRQPHVWRTIGAGLAATAMSVVAALGLGVMPRLSAAGAVAGWPAGVAPAAVPVPVAVPSNLTPSLVGAMDDVPALYADGCHADYAVVVPRPCTFGDPTASRTIVLFGDSHAAQWFPALLDIADATRSRLVVYTKSSCPSVSLDVRISSDGGRDYTECTRWRSAAIEQIDALAPTIVVIANYRRVDLAAGDDGATWGDGLARTLAALPPGTAAVLSDTPTFAVAPAICLSGHLHAVATCGAPAGDVVDAAHDAVERAVTTAAGGRFVDTSAWTCPAGDCAPIRADVLVYRDRHHLTTRFATVLAPELRSSLGL